MMKKVNFKVGVYISMILFSFNVYSWNTPAVGTPSNNSLGISVGVIINWGSVASSQAYTVQIDTTPSFNSPLLVQVTKNYINTNSSNGDTEHFIDDLYFGQKYYWRVRAYVPGDTSLWSISNGFTTLNSQVISSPANNSTGVFTGVLLNWSTNDYVDFYDLEIDTTPNFNSSLLVQVTKNYINTNSSNGDTEHLIDDLYFGQKYYWRVRARNAVNASNWSSIFNFTTLNNVSLGSPANYSLNINTNGQILNWITSNYVDFYDLELDTTLNFNSPLLKQVTENYINTTSTNPDTEEPSGVLLANTVYYWRVRARNAVDTSQWNVRVFSTGTNIVPEAPNLFSPSNGSFNVSTTTNIDWTDVLNATSFEYEYALDTNFDIIVSNGYSFNSIANITGLTLLTKYFWRVRSINANGIGLWSEVWSFKTDATTDLINNNTSNDIVVYPNPSNNGVFNLSSDNSIESIEVFDVSGKILLNRNIGHMINEIDLSKHDKGIYFIKISQANVYEIKQIIIN